MTLDTVPPALASRAPKGRSLVAVAVLVVAFACSDQPSAPVSPARFEITDVVASLTPTQLAKLVASEAGATDLQGLGGCAESAGY
jgi:hypothetical protein